MYPVIIRVYFLPTFLNCIQITGEKEKKGSYNYGKPWDYMWIQDCQLTCLRL